MPSHADRISRPPASILFALSCAHVAGMSIRLFAQMIEQFFFLSHTIYESGCDGLRTVRG